MVGAARNGDSAFLQLPVWLDAGNQDPFQPADRAFIAGLRSAGARLTAHTTWPGGHVGSYWDKHWLAYFHFYVKALAHCHPGG